jgi:protein TonB
MAINLNSTLKLNFFSFLFFSIILSGDLYSQKQLSKVDEKNITFKTLAEVEVKPEFPGGIEKFYKFVGNNFNRSDKEPSGKILAQFIIEKDGGLSNIEIIKNEVGVISGEEYIRVLKKCPKWIPASDNGKLVRVIYKLPITLQGGK